MSLTVDPAFLAAAPRHDPEARPRDLAVDFLDALTTGGAPSGTAQSRSCPAAPLVAVSPQDSDAVDELIRMCAKRLARLLKAFANVMHDMRSRMADGASLSDLLDSGAPLFPGGPTFRQRVEELLEEMKALMRNFDGTRCPELISPEARGAYHDLRGRIAQLDRQVKGAGGFNVDLTGALEGVGMALQALLSIMRRLDPSPAH